MTLWIPSDVLGNMMRETARETPTAKTLEQLRNHPMRQLLADLITNDQEGVIMSNAINMIIRTVEDKICYRMKPGLEVLATETMEGALQPINVCVPVCIHRDRDNRHMAILEPPTMKRSDGRWRITFRQAHDIDLWEEFVETRPTLRQEYDWVVELII